MKDIYNQKNFDLFMQKYTELSNEEKRENIINELKFLLEINSQLCETVNAPFDVMYNKEMGDLKNEKVSEKDFLEAVFAYIYLVKASSSLYMEEYKKELLEKTDLDELEA